MCDFVPGQAVAVGPIDALREIGDGLPGQLGPVTPLIHPDLIRNGDHPLSKAGFVVLKTEPGLEVHAVSRLSARLGGALQHNAAAVDLNHILPLSSPLATRSAALQLSRSGLFEARGLQRLLRDLVPGFPSPLRVAVLDSGLLPTYSAYRDVRYLDYSHEGGVRLDTAAEDPRGHGTRVTSILDQVLPPDVALSVGRLPTDENALTALSIARALGDIIVREEPAVVNLSVSIRNDFVRCPWCQKTGATPTFFSSLLPTVIRMASLSKVPTKVVMAAGNSGQIANSRWLTDDIDNLLLAYAENAQREPTDYSCRTSGPLWDLYSVGAFGGDDPDQPNAQGVFTDGSHGTSFAAPFVTAAAIGALCINEGRNDTNNRIGPLISQLIRLARDRVT